MNIWHNFKICSIVCQLADLPCGAPMALCSSDEKCLIHSGEIREDYSNWITGADTMFPVCLCVLQLQVCQKRLGSGSRAAFTLHFPKYSRSMNPASTGWRVNAQSQGEVVALGSAWSLPGQAERFSLRRLSNPRERGKFKGNGIVCLKLGCVY